MTKSSEADLLPQLVNILASYPWETMKSVQRPWFDNNRAKTHPNTHPTWINLQTRQPATTPAAPMQWTPLKSTQLERAIVRVPVNSKHRRRPTWFQYCPRRSRYIRTIRWHWSEEPMHGEDSRLLDLTRLYTEKNLLSKMAKSKNCTIWASKLNAWRKLCWTEWKAWTRLK